MITASRHRPVKLAAWSLSVLLVISFITAVAFGSTPITIKEMIAALIGEPLPGYKAEIIRSLRLPRALLAAGTGAVLAMSGAFLQGLFRNPLADPSLIGVTAGASVGASLAIFFGSASLGLLGGLSLVSLGAFTGGLLTVWLVYRVATTVNGTSVATMLLMGIAATSLAVSFIGLLEFFADNEMLRRMSLWRMGALDAANYARAAIIFAVLIALLISMPWLSKALNTLLLGESQARHLGVDVERVKTRIIVLVAAGVGLAVALAGSIAFVGLVVPHMVRLWVGPDHRKLLPLTALGGACLLLIADTISRVVVAPTELPVGLVTAIVGAPFFIVLLYQRRGGLR